MARHRPKPISPADSPPSIFLRKILFIFYLKKKILTQRYIQNKISMELLGCTYSFRSGKHAGDINSSVKSQIRDAGNRKFYYLSISYSF